MCIIMNYVNHTLNSDPYFLIDTVRNRLKIAGESCYRDAAKFFEPINNWLADFLQNDAGKLTVDFEIKSFNLTAAEILFNMTKCMNANASKGQEIIVNFSVFENNDTAYKLAKNFWEEFSDVKLSIIKR